MHTPTHAADKPKEVANGDGSEPTRAKTDNTCMCTDSIGFTREKRKLYTYQKVRGNPSPPLHPHKTAKATGKSSQSLEQ